MSRIFDHAEPGDQILFVNGSRHLAAYYWVESGRPNGPTPLTEPFHWEAPRRIYPKSDAEEVVARARRGGRIWVLIRHGAPGFGKRQQDRIVQVTRPRHLVQEWWYGADADVRLYG